jgi:hypothetical protein
VGEGKGNVTGKFDKSLKLEKCRNRDKFKSFHDENEARKLSKFTRKATKIQSTVQTPHKQIHSLKFPD